MQGVTRPPEKTMNSKTVNAHRRPRMINPVYISGDEDERITTDVSATSDEHTYLLGSVHQLCEET